MESVKIAPITEKISIAFEYLPPYASYIVDHEFEDFVSELMRLYEKTDLPIGRLFESMSHEGRRALIAGSTREILNHLATGRVADYIDHAISSWLKHQIPTVAPEQVQSLDFTLVNYIRSTVFRKFIPRYTNDHTVWTNLVEELDRFTVVLDSELFTAYMETQQQAIQQMNTEMQRREEQLLEAQEIGQVGSFEWDLIGKDSNFTRKMFQIFEMDQASNITAFLRHVHPDEREKVKKAIEKAFIDGEYECEYRYFKNNREKVILSRGKVTFLDGRPSKMIGTVADVTERHRIVQKLQESERLHKQAQAITHIGNWSWMIDENKVTWSDEMYRIYGLDPQSEEITFERFMSFVHPDEREKRITEINRSLETLQVEEYHLQITAATGETKILRGKGELICNRDGEPIVMLGTCQDVTREFMLTKQLKEREQYLEELNRSLQNANQELSRTNEELESFNFIASHDLQEPLRKIQIYTNRILEKGAVELSPALQDYFDRIDKASKRMQKLIDDFLVFSQTFKAIHVAEEVNMDSVIHEITAELSTRIEEKRADIRVSSLPSVYAAPFQIKQLLTNLISNALKYTRSDTSPKIVITGGVVRGAEVHQEGSDPEKSYAKVSIADNGIGFEPQYRAKIFELFQRLHSKNVYSGTGIGLALCKKVVQSLDGFITAESEPGKGSVFTVFIPLQTSALTFVNKSGLLN